MFVGQNDVDLLLDFLRIDKSKVDLIRIDVDFDNRGIEVVELIYVDNKTKKLNRCIIGINGVNRADVPITAPR
jgi:hypothetical protein